MTSSGGAVQIEALDGFALGATLHSARPSRGVALIVSGAMAATYLGDRCPQAWRDAARGLLFASERPWLGDLTLER